MFFLFGRSFTNSLFSFLSDFSDPDLTAGGWESMEGTWIT